MSVNPICRVFSALFSCRRACQQCNGYLNSSSLCLPATILCIKLETDLQKDCHQQHPRTNTANKRMMNASTEHVIGCVTNKHTEQCILLSVYHGTDSALTWQAEDY